MSGLSSGGFFAHQFHLAHSALVTGAGIIAGGPYCCVETIANPHWPHQPLDWFSAALVACTHFSGDRFWGLRPAPPRAEDSLALVAEARRRGAIVRPLGDVVVLMPPLSITKEELTRLVRITAAAIEEATAAEAVPLAA